MIKASNIVTGLDQILRYATQESLMEHYLGIKVTKKLVTNPMREDQSPGCSFFYSPSGILFFKDWALDKRWSCVGVVMDRFNLNFTSALEKINQDLIKGLVASVESKKDEMTICPKYQIITKAWEDSALSYWSKFGITQTILEKFNVLNVKYVFNNKRMIFRATKQNPIFAYYLPGSSKIKIYRPLSPSKTMKWRNSFSGREIMGMEQLPDQSHLLIVTSSLKDVMCLHTLGFHAICNQAEAVDFDKELIANLKKRFQYIVFFMDSDEPGIRANIKHSSEHRLCSMSIPLKEEAKDISDLVALKGQAYAYKVLKSIISTAIRNFNKKIILPF